MVATLTLLLALTAVEDPPASEAAADQKESEAPKADVSVEGPPGWRYEIVPAVGESIIAAKAEVAADGIAIKDGAKFSWPEVRRLNLLPPEGWTKDSRVVIREDGNVGVTTTEGSIKLTGNPGGYHRFHIAYVHYDGDPTLKLEMKGGAVQDWQEIPASLFYQPREQGVWNRETESAGFDEAGFRLPDRPPSLKRGLTLRAHTWDDPEQEPGVIRDIRSIPLLGYSGVAAARVPDAVKGEDLDEQFACVIYGVLRVPSKGPGEYSFRLTNDGLSQMSVGGWPPDLPERTRPPKETEWDVALGQGGFARGVLESFVDGVLTVRPQLGLNDEENTNGVPSLPLHRELVRELWRSTVAEDFQRIEEPDDADVLYAAGKSGEVRGVTGKLKAIDGENLTFELNGEDRPLPLDRVRGVVFAETILTDPTAAEGPEGPLASLDFLGPTQIPGKMSRVEGDVWYFEPLGGSTEILTNKRYIDGIDVSGGRSVWMTQMKYTAERTPYFDLPPVLTVNETPGGTTMRVGAERFSEFFAVGPKTTLTFDLAGSFNRLTAKVGMPTGVAGDAAVRVKAGDDVLFARDSLTEDDGAVDVTADISGRKAITLEVDFGAGGDADDLVVWGDPELIRE